MSTDMTINAKLAETADAYITDMYFASDFKSRIEFIVATYNSRVEWDSEADEYHMVFDDTQYWAADYGLDKDDLEAEIIERIVAEYACGCQLDPN